MSEKHHLDFLNPNENEIPREKMTELDYANLSCQELKEDIERMRESQKNAIVKITMLIDGFQTLEDKEYYSNKLKEIINDLKL